MKSLQCVEKGEGSLFCDIYLVVVYIHVHDYNTGYQYSCTMTHIPDHNMEEDKGHYSCVQYILCHMLYIKTNRYERQWICMQIHIESSESVWVKTYGTGSGLCRQYVFIITISY